MDGRTRLFSALQKKFCPIPIPFSTRTEHSSLAICSLTRSLRIYTLTYEGHSHHEAQDAPVRVHWTNNPSQKKERGRMNRHRHQGSPFNLLRCEIAHPISVTTAKDARRLCFFTRTGRIDCSAYEGENRHWSSMHIRNIHAHTHRADCWLLKAATGDGERLSHTELRSMATSHRS